MSCHDASRLICDYLEGRLSPVVEAEIADHLTACDECCRILDAAESALERDFGVEHRHLPHPHSA
jgi:anti-sigma factor ChrR (cupin superfamily)